jgi:hypothetical protein
MSVIADIRTFILTYAGLDDAAGMLIDVLGKTPTQYAIVPLPGTKVLETYLNDSSLRQYPFALQSMESVADDATRLAINEFYEGFAEWLEGQNADGILPTLGTGKTAETIESLGQPILFEFGESGTGIFQIQCRLTYRQQP